MGNWNVGVGTTNSPSKHCPSRSGRSLELNDRRTNWRALGAALRSAGARTVDALIEAMGEGLRSIRAADIRGWFRHSGYPTDSSTVTVNEKPL